MKTSRCIGNREDIMRRIVDQQKKKEEALLKLMQDTSVFDSLSKWTNKINIFDVLKISKTEIKHSNVLGWLLDPNENHGLEDSFLYGILSKLSIDLDNDVAIRLLSSDFNTFKVSREWRNIDILLISHECKTVIAIENKIGSKEHDAGNTGKKQSVVYKNKVEKTFNDYNRIFVYLTPDGEEPEDGEWITLTYDDIVKILDSVYKVKEGQLSFEAKLLISNYISCVKYNVTIDEDLLNLCNNIYNTHQNALDYIFHNNKNKRNKNNDISCSAIYNKHRQIIDLIYENREDKVLQRSKICRDVLKNMGDDIETDKSNSKAYINFWTTGLEQLFQNVDKKYYHYLIEIRKDHIGLYLEYHKDKKEVLKDETFNAMQNAGKNFVEALKEKNTKDGDWNWYRVWSVILHNSLDDETRIRKWIEEEISKIKEKDGTNRIKDELI